MIENIGGLYAGEVVSLKDPEHRGRIKVKIAELLGEATSNWCEPCVPCCFENGGDFCLPELKDYVWVAFMNGELDSPVYLGGWWTQDSTPLGDNYKNIYNTRIISFGNMQIKFNSDKDSIDIISSDGDSKKVLSVTPDKVCVDGKSITSGGGSIDVDEDFSETSENPLMNRVVTKALKEKVDKIEGKGLSTNDFDSTYKKNVDENTKHRSDEVLHITSEERKTWNSKSDFSGLFSDLYGIPNWVNSETKPKYSKSEVGLSNVDNTSDLDKPISNSVQKALDNKVDNDTLATHTGNGVIHITSEERKTWNSKSDFSGNYSDLKGKPYKLSDFEDDLGNSPVHTHSQYLTSESLIGYATESWVTNKNYLTKITKEQVTEALGYTPPTTDTTYGVATSSNLGLVKSGTDITVDSSGNVRVNDDSHNHVISNIDGLQTTLDGKAASSHTHDYLPLSGGTVTGATQFNNYLKLKAWSGYGTGTANFWYDANNKFVEIENATDLKLAGTKVSKKGHTHTKSQITDFPTSLPANGGTSSYTNIINGTYTSNGGSQPPSYIESGKVRFNMMNCFKGLTSLPTYADCLLMDTYTGSDVPYVTGLGIIKASGNPRAFIAVGAKGNTTTWASQTELITEANIGSQSVNYATSAGAIKDSVGNSKNIKFGIDSNGNYGYIKDGADTVYPFNTLQKGTFRVYSINYKTSSSSGMAYTGSNMAWLNFDVSLYSRIRIKLGNNSTSRYRISSSSKSSTELRCGLTIKLTKSDGTTTTTNYDYDNTNTITITLSDVTKIEFLCYRTQVSISGTSGSPAPGFRLTYKAFSIVEIQ